MREYHANPNPGASIGVKQSTGSFPLGPYIKLRHDDNLYVLAVQHGIQVVCPRAASTSGPCQQRLGIRDGERVGMKHVPSQVGRTLGGDKWVPRNQSGIYLSGMDNLNGSMDLSKTGLATGWTKLEMECLLSLRFCQTRYADRHDRIYRRK
jgi:hypothetical protein